MAARFGSCRICRISSIEQALLRRVWFQLISYIKLTLLPRSPLVPFPVHPASLLYQIHPFYLSWYISSKMKCYTVVAIALVVLGVHAQSRNDIPPCALPCIDDAVKKNTNCDATDFTCICPKLQSIQGPIGNCVLQECGPTGVTLSMTPSLHTSRTQTDLIHRWCPGRHAETLHETNAMTHHGHDNSSSTLTISQHAGHFFTVLSANTGKRTERGAGVESEFCIKFGSYFCSNIILHVIFLPIQEQK